ncbi:MAG: ABC transporter permease [Chthonomonas sp.]|nr:ABC transporter permease [Chthonomonas sp.]
MLDELRELWRFRELLLTLVERELRIRYKNSVLGFMWSLLNPLLTMGAMYVVFRYFLGNQTPSFSAYVFAAYLPYMFFQLALMDSSQSVLAALPVVKKVYFPREVLPLASVLSNFIHFLLALTVFFAFLLAVWMRHPDRTPFQPSLVYLPFLLIIHLALTTGLALFISAMNTFFEDVKYMVGVTLYIMFFFCPVMYFSEQVRYANAVPAKYSDLVYTLYHLNPVAMICTAFRKVLVAPVDPKIGDRVLPYLPLDVPLLLVASAISFLVLIGGYAVFNRMKWRFVERP